MIRVVRALAVGLSPIGPALLHPLRQGARLRLRRGGGRFGHAIAVAAAAGGTVFVADFQNNRIPKWRPNVDK